MLALWTRTWGVGDSTVSLTPLAVESIHRAGRWPARRCLCLSPAARGTTVFGGPRSCMLFYPTKQSAPALVVQPGA